MGSPTLAGLDAVLEELRSLRHAEPPAMPERVRKAYAAHERSSLVNLVTYVPRRLGLLG